MDVETEEAHLMFVGLIFVCVAAIPQEHCGMANAYAIFRMDYPFQSEAECIDGATHHFEAIEVSGDRNARVDCEPLLR